MTRTRTSYGNPEIFFHMDGVAFTAVRQVTGVLLMTDVQITDALYQKARAYATHVFDEMEASLSRSLAPVPVPATAAKGDSNGA